MNWTLLLIFGAALVALYAFKRSSFVAEGTAQRLLREGALIVDVRTPEEFGAGHLPGAVNIPLGELRSEVPRRVPDKDKVLLLHCRSGARSGIGKQQLQGMGYANVHNLGSYGRAEKIVRQAKGG
jgi:phage shock protein E